VQFAVLYRNGQKASMSTRSGEFVTLRELRGEVGNDACRFFYVLRKSDQHLDFDLDLAKSQTNENPVYYIQYAHARICSVMASGTATRGLAEADLAPAEQPARTGDCRQAGEFPEVIEGAARELAPHLIAFYLKDLAGEFHSWYNAERMLVDDVALKDARVALAAAVRQVIRNGWRFWASAARNRCKEKHVMSRDMKPRARQGRCRSGEGSQARGSEGRAEKRGAEEGRGRRKKRRRRAKKEEPKESKTPLFLQAGSFSTAQDADNQKAKLAFMGVEAVIQQVMIQDKTLFRVRVGPYSKIDELNKVRAELAKAGIEAQLSR
jgi:cell division septation protein DedD